MNWKVKSDYIGLNLGKDKGTVTIKAEDFNDSHLAVLKARAKNRNLDESEYLMKAGLVPSSPQKEIFEEAKVESGVSDELKAEYKEKFGRNPRKDWSIEEVLERMK